MSVRAAWEHRSLTHHGESGRTSGPGKVLRGSTFVPEYLRMTANSLRRPEIALQRHWIAFTRRLARLNAGKAARLDEPLRPRRQLPAPLAGKRRVPAHRLVLDVDALIMGVEQFDAMAVRIAHIDEQRVTRSVPARAKFDVLGKAHSGGKIADIKEQIGFRNAERGMMQPRPGAGCKHDVVRIALALQEHEQRIVAAVRRDVFGQPEAQPHVKLQLPLHVRHQQLEMVDALRHGAAMMLEGEDHPWLRSHGSAEFERRTERIADMECAALIRPFDPLRRQPRLLEI